MIDLPYPNINGESNEKKLAQINAYLIQLKDALEFALMGMSSENQSVSEALAKGLSNSNVEREDQLTQVSSKMTSEADNTKSAIEQTADRIMLEVAKKIGANEVVAIINVSPEEIELKGNRVVIESDNWTVDKKGSQVCKDLTINGGKICIKGTSTEKAPYLLLQSPTNPDKFVALWSDGISVVDYMDISNPNYLCKTFIRTENDDGYAELNGSQVNAYGFNNISLESKKKNFESLENALDIVNAIDIYKYHYKNDAESKKKHIGLVIGDGYNYSQEVTNAENTSVDVYSLAGVCVKAIKELVQIVEFQNKRIDTLEKNYKEI